MLLSCIGIGSNAIRMLEATWTDGGLCVLKRERRGTRLFAGLFNGRLQEESMHRSLMAVEEMAVMARADQTDELYIFATSAVRDAENGHEFTSKCEALSGVPVEIISGEEEAVLSYIGAMRGGRSAVIDIGGGSTEFTLGHDERIFAAKSLQMGAVRMNSQLPILSRENYQETVERCKRIIARDAKDMLVQKEQFDWTGVGGTMTTLGAMKQRIPLFDPKHSEGMAMTYEEIHGFGMRLSGMTLEERRHVDGLMPHRADIMPSGIAILDAAMTKFHIETIRLSAQGNLDGYLKKKFSQTLDK